MSVEKQYAPRNDGKREPFLMKLDPRLKYLAGIAARQERKSVSHLVENSIEAYLQGVCITQGGQRESVASMSAYLWHDSEAVRFTVFAQELPFLMTFEEEQLWQIIEERELTTPEQQSTLETIFHELRIEAKSRASQIPTESVNGYPFRGGKMDSTIPEDLVEPPKAKKRSSAKGGK